MNKLEVDLWHLKIKKKKKLIRGKGSEIESYKRFFQGFKKEFIWGLNYIKDLSTHYFTSDNRRYYFDEGEIIKIWDFNQANNEKISSFYLDYKNDKFNDMHNWFVTCDADFDVGLCIRSSNSLNIYIFFHYSSGFSSCSWTVSPSGYGLFSGYLDNNIPKDGKITRSGYAYLGSYKCSKPFSMLDDHLEFGRFTHIVLRIRGDGRRYNIIFNTSDILDITWFDHYQYMLYTHGGPHWQYVKVILLDIYLFIYIIYFNLFSFRYL